MKICKRCHKELPINNFKYRKDTGKYRNICNSCIYRQNKLRETDGTKLELIKTYKYDPKGDGRPCSVCNKFCVWEELEKNAAAAHPSGRGTRCLACSTSRSAEYASKIKDTEEYKLKNIQRSRKWRSENVAKVTAASSRRRARLKNAYTDVTRQQIDIINALYTAANLLASICGEPCDVHHIVPLYLGGKHELDNLEIITRSEHKKLHSSFPKK